MNILPAFTYEDLLMAELDIEIFKPSWFLEYCITGKVPAVGNYYAKHLELIERGMYPWPL